MYDIYVKDMNKMKIKYENSFEETLTTVISFLLTIIEVVLMILMDA